MPGFRLGRVGYPTLDGEGYAGSVAVRVERARNDRPPWERDEVKALFVVYVAFIVFGITYFSVIGLTHH
jgi:hypothetical protein